MLKGENQLDSVMLKIYVKIYDKIMCNIFCNQRVRVDNAFRDIIDQNISGEYFLSKIKH